MEKQPKQWMPVIYQTCPKIYNKTTEPKSGGYNVLKLQTNFANWIHGNKDHNNIRDVPWNFSQALEVNKKQTTCNIHTSVVLHDNVWPHTAQRFYSSSSNGIFSTTSSHSPDLALSDYFFFTNMKVSLAIWSFETTDDVN